MGFTAKEMLNVNKFHGKHKGSQEASLSTTSRVVLTDVKFLEV
jgi:hypothetical protein